jgi:hypothetical protein
LVSAIDQVSGTPGDAHLAAVVENLEADAGGLAGLGIGDRQIRQMDRRFLGDDPALGLRRLARVAANEIDASPRLPLSRPAMTMTVSPFLILAAITAPPARAR